MSDRFRRFLRRVSVRKVVIAALGVTVAATGAGIVANVWIDRTARPFLYAELAAVPPRTVAIVPGARVYRSGAPSPPLVDRLQTALDLYRAGRVRKILLSGDHAAPEYDEVNAMWRWMRERRVPDEDLFLDHAGLRTLDTMERARRVFLVADAVVCTQAFHLPRAVFLARRAGIDAVGLVADRRAYPREASDGFREMLARGVAFVDSYVLGTGPRHLGNPIPIDGDGRVTHDRWTAKRSPVGGRPGARGTPNASGAKGTASPLDSPNRHQ